MLGFAKVSWLSHTLFVSVLNILFLKEQVMAGGEVPFLQAVMSLDIPVGEQSYSRYARWYKVAACILLHHIVLVKLKHV